MTRQCAIHDCIHPAVNELELVTGVRVWVCNPHKYSFSKVTVKFLTLIALLLLGVGSAAAQCTKPVISNAIATPTTDGQGIVFGWSTSVPADSLVAYGVGNPGTFTPVVDTIGVTSHSVTVTGLQPSTQYGWGIRSQAISGGVGCGTGYFAFANGPADGSVTTHAPPSGPFTYQIAPIGPTYVTQGYGMYFQIRLVPLTGTYTPKSLTMVLSGLPAGATIRWSDDELWNVDVDTLSTTNGIVHDTMLIYTFDSKEPYVFIPKGIPPGSYTITITVSGSGGPTETATRPLNVVSSTVPFSGTAFPWGTPSAYPPIPNLATYLASADTYGQQTCEQDSSPYTGIRPNDPNHLTPVAACCTYGSWFYDGVMVYYNVENLLKNGRNWSQCRTNVQQVYRDNYALKQPIQTYMQFSEGAYLDYLKTGNSNDLAMINKFMGGLQYWYHGSWVDTNLQREIAYVLRNTSHGVALGQNVPDPFGHPSPFWRDYAEDHILGMVDQICLSRNAPYWENFMVGLQAEALIQYYTLANKDPRIPPALACLADFMYQTQWQAIDPNSFPYDKYAAAFDISKANGSTDCQNVLNQLISPMYAWLFSQTGLAQYQVEGDAIWSGGVLMNECGGPAANLTWPFGSDGKFFSQQYYWGPDYVYWRSPQQPQPSTMWPASNGGTLQ